MSVTKTMFAGLFVLILLVTRINAAEPVDVEAEAGKLMAMETEWSDKTGAKDLDGVMAFFAKDAIVIAPGEPPTIGLEAIRASTEASMAAEGVHVSFESVAAFVAPSGEMAWDYGTTRVELADGTVTDGNYLVVWTREGGEWKVAADIFN